MNVPALTVPEARAAFERDRLACLLALAEAAGCRLATQAPFIERSEAFPFGPIWPLRMNCDFGMLVPGEWPPDSSCRWTLWELRADGWQSREVYGRDREAGR